MLSHHARWHYGIGQHNSPTELAAATSTTCKPIAALAGLSGDGAADSQAALPNLSAELKLLPLRYRNHHLQRGVGFE